MNCVISAFYQNVLHWKLVFSPAVIENTKNKWSSSVLLFYKQNAKFKFSNSQVNEDSQDVTLVLLNV